MIVLGLVMALALPTIGMGSVDSTQPVVVRDIRLIYFLCLKWTNQGQIT